MFNLFTKRLILYPYDMLEFEKQMISYFTHDDFKCDVNDGLVLLEFKPDIVYGSLNDQKDKLLDLFCIPIETFGYRNLISILKIKNDNFYIRLDLRCDDDEQLFLKYFCSVMIRAFKKVERKSKIK